MADLVFEEMFSDEKALKYLQDIEKQLTETGKAADAMGETVTKAVDGVAKSEDLLAKAVKEEAAAEEARAAKRAENAKKFEQQEKDAAKRYEEYLAQLDAESQKTAQVAKSIMQAEKANKGWAAAIKETVAGQRLGGKSLAEWAEQAKGFVGRIGDAAKKIPGVSLAARGLGLALKATGIGSIIALLTGFVGALFKVQSVADKVSQVMAGVNAVVAELARRVVLLGSAVVKVFSGDFSGAANDAVAAVTGIGDALADAAVQAYTLEKRLQALRDVTITQSVEAARARVELEKFRQIVDDGTQSIGARIRASKQAAEIEKSLAAQAVDRALEAQQIAQAKFALDRESLAAREEAAKAEVDFQEAVANLNKVTFDAEKEQREFRKEAAEERRKQQEEELKKAEALRKEYEKLFADIQNQAAALNIENTFNPVERVIKQYQAAIDETKALRERLLTIAPGEAEKAKVEEAISKLFDEIAIKYREELNKAEDELNELKGGKIREALIPLPPAGTIDDDLKFRAQGIIKQLQEAAQEAIDAQQPRTLAQILGISDEGLEGLRDAAGQIVDSLNQIADARLKEAEAATQAAEKKVDAAEEFLIRQQELAAEGLANDTDLAKQQLEIAKKAREEALKEEAKARRSQILLDSAGQISSLVTASANIFKSLSSIPIAGIPLAIATIGVMFGAFAKAKADALKAASIPKFRKGGKLEGPAHEFGGIAISDSDGNVYGEAEGGEWIVNRQESREHDRFLKRLNDGEFAGVDLDRVFKLSASNPLADAAPRIARIEAQRREMETTMNIAAMAAAYEKTAAQIVQAIREQPEIYPLTNYKVRRRKGQNTYTEIVREEK